VLPARTIPESLFAIRDFAKEESQDLGIACLPCCIQNGTALLVNEVS
jgi:hypothetical protein